MANKMTKLPLVSLRSVASSLPIHRSLPKLPFLMASTAATDPSSQPNPPAAAAEPNSDYPVPLTPPYPALSKDVELRRAISASARSASVSSIPIDVLFDDEWISVVHKPAGIYCESILNSINNTLSCNAATTGTGIGSNLHLANRLDRDTSGLMVVTKHNRAAAGLVKAFTDHTVCKTYLALCVGGVPEWREVRVVSGHGRSKHGAWRVYSVDDVDRVLPGGSRVRRMETAFEVLSVNGVGTWGEFPEPRKVLNTGTCTGTDTETKLVLVRDKMSEFGEKESVRRDEVLVRAYPKSGRTHQIRLHCQYLGLPIRGDLKYGGMCEWDGMECEFHALHAETLSFTHPITKVPLYFKAPLPPWVREFVCNSTDNMSAG